MEVRSTDVEVLTRPLGIDQGGGALSTGSSHEQFTFQQLVDGMVCEYERARKELDTMRRENAALKKASHVLQHPSEVHVLGENTTSLPLALRTESAAATCLPFEDSLTLVWHAGGWDCECACVCQLVFVFPVVVVTAIETAALLAAPSSRLSRHVCLLSDSTSFSFSHRDRDRVVDLERDMCRGSPPEDFPWPGDVFHVLMVVEKLV